MTFLASTDRFGRSGCKWGQRSQQLCIHGHAVTGCWDGAFRGTTKETRGTAYVVYEDIYDAKNACDHLSGFNVANRYLIVLYFNPIRHSKKVGS